MISFAITNYEKERCGAGEALPSRRRRLNLGSLLQKVKVGRHLADFA